MVYLTRSWSVPKLIIKDTDETIEAAAGTPVSELFEFDGLRSVPFNCMRGICGSCAVKPVTDIDYLGDVHENEKGTLEILALCPTEYRLLCQCTLVCDSEVELA
nr:MULTISPECIES: 2Fe-2S iron-sulfur cluster-binding protein [unclassified Photobacterium]